MLPLRTIYLINQTPRLFKAWRELSKLQKRLVIKECETTEDEEAIEKVIREVASGGQRNLF